MRTLAPGHSYSRCHLLPSPSSQSRLLSSSPKHPMQTSGPSSSAWIFSVHSLLFLRHFFSCSVWTEAEIFYGRINSPLALSFPFWCFSFSSVWWRCGWPASHLPQGGSSSTDHYCHHILSISLEWDPPQSSCFISRCISRQYWPCRL